MGRRMPDCSELVKSGQPKFVTIQGHSFVGGGSVFGEDGERIRQTFPGQRVTGRSHCSCGWRSAVLPTTTARRSAYREHLELERVLRDEQRDPASVARRKVREVNAAKRAGVWSNGPLGTPPQIDFRDGRVEAWRPIAGYEGRYQISSFGRVHSVFGRKSSGGLLACTIAKRGGYLIVGLTKNAKLRTFTVHGLVAEAFIGPRPEGYDIRHLDGNPLNPSVENLAYGTRSENNLDMAVHGTNHHRNKTHCPKGHLYDEENTRLNRRGGRCCRRCEGWGGMSKGRRRPRATGSAQEEGRS